MSILLTAALLLGLVPTVSVAGADTALTAKPGSKIRIDGNNAVWMSYGNGNWDIYHRDLSSRTETRITKDPNTQGYPAVWANIIVWQDNRNYAPGDITRYDIYTYDMNTKEEKKISTLEGNHQEPVIANNKVVWVNAQNGNRDVILCDLQTGTTRKVSSDGAKAFGVSFDGSVIAWMDGRDGDLDIFMYDLSAGEEKQLTYGLGDETDPVVSGGKVAWEVEHNGVTQVYLYETAKGYSSRVTDGNEDHRILAFSGNSMLLLENGNLGLTNVDRITQQPVKSPSGQIPLQAFINGDKVTWFDGQSFTTETINAAIERAGKQDTELTPTPISTPQPTQPSKGGSSGDGSAPVITENKEGKLVKAGQDNTITSEDGLFTLKIPKGCFDSDIYVNVKNEGSITKPGYAQISQLYRWEFEGGAKPKFPIETTINYKEQHTAGNVKKICMYQVGEGDEVKPLTAKRNQEAGTLTASLTNRNKVVLLVYSRSFTDTEKHWAKETLEVIASHQIIRGYEDGSFQPDHEMTRAEFVKVITNSMNLPEHVPAANESGTFKDVPEGFWAKGSIYAAYKKGWIKGSDGCFYPDQPITREQIVTILLRIYSDQEKETLTPANLDSYSDAGTISTWAVDSMAKAVGMGLLQGFDSRLLPLANATRAEVAAMVYRYLDKLGRL